MISFEILLKEWETKQFIIKPDPDAGLEWHDTYYKLSPPGGLTRKREIFATGQKSVSAFHVECMNFLLIETSIKKTVFQQMVDKGNNQWVWKEISDPILVLHMYSPKQLGLRV